MIRSLAFEDQSLMLEFRGLGFRGLGSTGWFSASSNSYSIPHLTRVKINLLLNSQGLSLGMRTPPGILTTDADERATPQELLL